MALGPHLGLNTHIRFAGEQTMRACAFTLISNGSGLLATLNACAPCWRPRMADIHIVRKHALGLLAIRKIAFRWAELAEAEFGMRCVYLARFSSGC